MNKNNFDKNTQKLLMAFIVIIALNLQSCGKYEEGPAISLKSKTKRLAADWELADYDGEFFLEEFYDSYGFQVDIKDAEISLEFEDDGDVTFKAEYTIEYEYSYYGYTYTDNVEVEIDGEWEFSSDKESIEIDFDRNDYDDYIDDYDETEFKIIKLASNEIILETETGAEWTFEQ